jgi:tRNA(fMet)-specific endonuclease VapC
VAVSAITFSELWFGVEIETSAVKARRRRRWIEKVFRRLEIVPLDRRVAHMHSRLWARLSAAGRMIGPHDLIVAATALQRRWAVATFNAREFRHVPGLEVIQPQ